jgi:hypothetical protein
MIASWRGLAIAAAVAVALVIAVVVDLGRAPAVVDRALVPGFDPERVTELVWERAGQPALRVVRTGDGWELRAPENAASRPAPASRVSEVTPVPADPGAIGEVLAALRGARWHRRGEPTPVHVTLSVVASDRRRVLGIGEPLAGADQTWVVDGDRGLVVDRWVARALDRDRLSLWIKRPLGDIRGADAITLDGALDGRAELRVIGRPRQLAGPRQLVLAADVADELERAVAEIEIVRLVDGASGAAGLTITAARGARRTTVVVGGACPGAAALVAISAAQGEGCIERAAAEALERAAHRLVQPAAAIVNRRPIPFEPRSLVLVDGVALDTSPPRVGGAAADPARVAELLFALGAPAEVVALPATPAAQHLVVTDRAGTPVTLDLFPGHILARHGEPIALRPAPGAWQLLVRPSRELRDVTPWFEEPTTITELRIDGVRYVRGAVIGDWTRVPAGSAATATSDTTGRRPARPAEPSGPHAARLASLIEALVAQLAAPRSHGFADLPVTVAHRVTIVVTPPVGAPSQHVLELGAPRPDGCPARVDRTGGASLVDRDALLLPAAVCAQVAALANHE